jgi:hypothetical protein
MRILFDQGTPVPLRDALAGHVVVTAFELSWNNLENGELLRMAEADGFEVLVTTDHRAPKRLLNLVNVSIKQFYP